MSIRQILHRLIQIAIIVAALRFLIHLRWDKIALFKDELFWAVLTTINLTLLSLAIGFILAWPIAIYRINRPNEFLAKFLDGFVAAFRGTPLLVQLFIIYYGLAGVDWIRESVLWIVLKNAYWCAIIAFSLNAAAYASEIFRGALNNVSNGLLEAARSLGMSERQVLWKIWMPLAWRGAIPQYSNEIIFMMHGTALAGLVTISDIFGVSRDINRKFYLTYEGLITAALLYIGLTLLISYLTKKMEMRWLSYQNQAH